VAIAGFPLQLPAAVSSLHDATQPAVERRHTISAADVRNRDNALPAIHFIHAGTCAPAPMRFAHVTKPHLFQHVAVPQQLRQDDFLFIKR
jgi:hypothetical protein